MTEAAALATAKAYLSLYGAISHRVLRVDNLRHREHGGRRNAIQRRGKHGSFGWPSTKKARDLDDRVMVDTHADPCPGMVNIDG